MRKVDALTSKEEKELEVEVEVELRKQ